VHIGAQEQSIIEAVLTTDATRATRVAGTARTRAEARRADRQRQHHH
jgi:hypothetical protein